MIAHHPHPHLATFPLANEDGIPTGNYVAVNPAQVADVVIYGGTTVLMRNGDAYLVALSKSGAQLEIGRALSPA